MQINPQFGLVKTSIANNYSARFDVSEETDLTSFQSLLGDKNTVNLTYGVDRIELNSKPVMSDQRFLLERLLAQATKLNASIRQKIEGLLATQVGHH